MSITATRLPPGTMHASRGVTLGVVEIGASVPHADIAAALASPTMRGVSRQLHAAGLSAMKGPVTVADLDAHLAETSLKSFDRLALKIALGKVGLLK